ncbi:MAG: nucleotidyltransferase domain-containing protein [Bacteroides sp.]|nr:nucleotidyltransferase domain-containing protein [Bacteroides sp.]
MRVKADVIGLEESELDELIEILSSDPYISGAILYGSRAKGTYKPFSDLDITLKGDKLSIDTLAELQNKFYYSSLPYLVDLSIFDRLKNDELIDHIRRRGITLYSRNS